MPRGESLTLAQIWALSNLWYSNRMDLTFHARSTTEAADIFRQLGLTSPFWQWAAADTP
jgi:hypothetical protein